MIREASRAAIRGPRTQYDWSDVLFQISAEESSTVTRVYDEGPNRVAVTGNAITLEASPVLLGTRCIDFTDHTSFLGMDLSSVWDLAEDWTFSMTFRSKGSTPASINEQLCGWWQSTSGQRGFIVRLDYSDDTLRFLYTADGNTTQNSGSSFIPTAGVDHHLVVVHDSTAGASGEVRLYVDGALIHTVALSGAIWQPSVNFRVGSYVGISASPDFYIDNVVCVQKAVPSIQGEENPLIRSAPALYSWWIHPLALYDGGELFFGGVMEAEGTQVMFSFDSHGRMTGRSILSTVYDQDDHNAPAVARMGDGNLIVVYTGHAPAGDLRLRYRTGADVNSLGAEAELIGASTQSTYAQVFTRGDEVWVFCRRGEYTNNWVLYRSLDNAATWENSGSIQQVFIGSEGPGLGNPALTYMAVRQIDEDTLRVFGTLHPSTFIGIVSFDIDMASGDVTHDGAVIGNVITGTNMPLVFTGSGTPSAGFIPLINSDTASDSVRLLDVSDDGNHVLYCHFDYAGPSWSAEYRVAEFTGVDFYDPADWTHNLVAYAGEPFYATTRYFGGAVFDRSDPTFRTIITSEEASGTWRIVSRRSSDDGASWPESHEFSVDSDNFLIRPYSPVGASALRNVIWQNVQSFPAFTSFAGARTEF